MFSVLLEYSAVVAAPYIDISGRWMMLFLFFAFLQQTKQPSFLLSQEVSPPPVFGHDGRIPAHMLSKIAPTWKVVYEVGLANFMHHQPTDWSPPSVWAGAWAKTDTLKRLTPDPETVTRRSPAVWKAFWRSKLPPSIVDFVHQVLWRKLKVAERLSSSDAGFQVPCVWYH